MKNKILGWIGIIWGGLICLNVLLRFLSGSAGTGSYFAGTLVGLVLGILMVAFGIRSLKKRIIKANSENVENEMSK